MYGVITAVISVNVILITEFMLWDEYIDALALFTLVNGLRNLKKLIYHRTHLC